MCGGSNSSSDIKFPNLPLRTVVTSLVRRTVAAVLCLVVVSPSQAQDSPRDGYRLAPKVFRAAVERIKPCLVTIEAFGGIGPSEGRTKRGSGISQPGDGPTTGLVISPDGYIATSTFNFVRK